MPHQRGQITGRLSPFLERQRILRAVPFLRDKPRILDVGCGRARLLRHVNPPETYVGVDLLADVIADARVAHPQHRFETGDIEGSALPPEGPFDAIVMLAVLEHLSAPGTTLRKLASLLSHAGVLVLTTPHPFAEPVHRLGARLGLFSREAAEEHTTTFNRGGMEKLASEAGLRMLVSRRFQLGLNQLFVLTRSTP